MLQKILEDRKRYKTVKNQHIIQINTLTFTFRSKSNKNYILFISHEIINLYLLINISYR